MTAQVKAFYHQSTSTLSYIVFDHVGGHAVVIDSALDFAANSGQVETHFVDQLLAFIKDNSLTLDWILETHAHADHLSAASYVKSKLGGKIAVGKRITEVQKTFKSVLDISDDELWDGNDGFDHLFEDNESFSFGSLTGLVLMTPGHTCDSVTYLVQDNAFIGDTLFMPDFGSARCDFPGGDAEVLYDSIMRLYGLPGDTKLWICHDYQPGGRELAYLTSVAESKAENIHLSQNVTKEDFIKFRQERDSQLDVPKLLYPSVQVNIRAGQLPVRFFKIPVVSEKL
ncbi:MBL fold metallo-hydrolase [Photobacterium sp. SDRW27]|uniref:MBL fold metallo-hydrolase n=1 Tax=Photobacterium obscurum TaxID=2829490 RepID=UPI0022441593|nr:MBL fold metallo-hydrolase [Photobacterium obscurum]MCW8328844.1 MBL fold metallo-hydrolase [Photobacterium obscurum]